GRFFKVLDDIAEENEVVTRKLAQEPGCVADVKAVVEIAVHRCGVGGVAFNAVTPHEPFLALVTGRVVRGLVDVSVFPKEMAPFPETDADVEDGFRFDLSNQVNDGRDGIGPAAGHAGPIDSRI